MCPSKPKAPQVQDIPIRAMAAMPDNGDPSVRLGLRTRRSLTTAAAVIANRGGKTLGTPSVSGPAGTGAI